MAQLLIFARDKVCGDYHLDAQNHKRGDVLLVYPDGQQHSQEVLTHPMFRIIEVPSLSINEAKTLLAPQVLGPNDTFVSEKTRQFRGFKLDLDDPLIPADLRAYVDDDTRKQDIFVIDLRLRLCVH
jgi:hypothetical protein